MEKINETIKFKLYVTARPTAFSEDKNLPFIFTVTSYDSSDLDNEHILLETFEQEFVIDGEYDLMGMQVEKLEEAKTLLIATHTRDIIALDEKINSLLAIEHNPEEVEDYGY